jgi:hypothetical protein
VEPEPADGVRPFLASRLTDSPEILAEVETAESLGISLKRFRGWEPTTHYTHRGGRLFSSQPEAEWDEEQQGWMLALKVYRDGRCPGCGGDLDVTTAAESEDRYRPELPLQCFRCVAFSQSRQAYVEQPHPETLLHLVQQRPRR